MFFFSLNFPLKGNLSLSTHTHPTSSTQQISVILTAMKFDLEYLFAKYHQNQTHYIPLFPLHGFCFNDTCLFSLFCIGGETKFGFSSC